MLALTLLVLGAGAGLQFAHASPGNDANAPSVAGPNDAVIAHGVSALPSGQIAWQVVQATAPPLGEGTAKPRMLSFPLAIHDAILISNQTTGQQTRLAPWEAAFTPADATQRRESLASGPVTYDQIAPVPASDAHSTSGSNLIFAGDPFSAPTGQRDLDLLKGHLSQGNTSEKLTTAPGTPLVILVLQGQLSVTTDHGTNATLLVGQAGSYSGTVTLTSRDTSASGTTFVAGIIGPAIPTGVATPPIVPATAQATASAQTGSIAILGRRCMAQAGPNPPPSFPAGAIDSCPAFPTGWDIKLIGPDGSTYSLADAQVQQVPGMSQAPINAYVWNNLPLGTYTFSGSDVTLPSGVSSFIAHFDDLPSDPFSIQTSDGYAIPLASDQPDRKVTIIFGISPDQLTPVAAPTSAASNLTLEFSIRACPPGDLLAGGHVPAAGTTEFCRKPDLSHDTGKPLAGAKVTISNVTTGQPSSGQTDAMGSVQFSGLPAGTYRATVADAAQVQGVCTGAGVPANVSSDIFNNPAGVAFPAGNVTCYADIIPALTGNPGTVTAFVAACNGIDPDHATTEQLTADCQQQLDGVTIHLEGNGFDRAQHTAGGQATWSNVNPGPISLIEAIPADYAAPAIDCSYHGPNGSGLFGAKSNTSGTIYHYLQPEEQLTCAFYHAPSSTSPPTATASAGTAGAGNSQTVVFAVRDCPPGDSFSSQPPAGAGAGPCLTPGGTQEDALAAAGTEIDLTNTATSQSTSGKTDASGDLDFHDVVSGPYKAAVPAAVQAESLCAGQHPAVELGDIVNSSTGITLANINVRCDVVILTAPPAGTPEATAPPVAGTTLALRIFNCPPGNSGNPNDDVTSCTPASADVALTLTTPGGQKLSLTDATAVGPGDWVFSNLPAESGFTLQETQLPAGYTGDTAWLIQSHGSMVQITGSFGLIPLGGNTINIYNIQSSSTATPEAATPVSS